MRRTFIGTAAWSVPRAVAECFDAGPSMLARYATRLDAVEINTSFYRPHRRATYERWASSVPDNFRFAVKMPKAITHAMRLAGAALDLTRFLDETAGLGDKRGPLLIQLPPSLAFDPLIAGAFFRDLRARTDARLACEPRHASWLTDEAMRLFDDCHVARVTADPVPAAVPAGRGGWGGLRYLRQHGSPRIYHSNYDIDALARLAEDIAASSVETWCIFDNTALGYATANALDLRERLDTPTSPR